jgi:H+/Cl- antiporter ClcA
MTGIFEILESSAMQYDTKMSPNSRFFFMVTSIVYGIYTELFCSVILRMIRQRMSIRFATLNYYLL